MDAVGAWFLGGYRRGMAGTLGESLDLVSIDNLGWTIRSIKYELVFCGFRGKMVLDSPGFGDAAHTETTNFQRDRGIAADGVVGPRTATLLLEPRITQAATVYGVRPSDIRGIVRHESSYDLGAIGYRDHNDRGCTQQHIYPKGSVNLSQAIRPALAIPRLAAHLARIAKTWDEETAVVSWNVGEGGAEWWFDNGKPATGSPSWWPSGDLAERATNYLASVRAE